MFKAILLLVTLTLGCGSDSKDVGRKETPPANPTPSEAPSTENEAPYAGLTSVFESEQEVLALADKGEALRRLRSIAEPSHDYHGDLFRIASEAEQLNTSDLELLMDAVYYPLPKHKAMTQELVVLKKSPTKNAENILLLGKEIRDSVALSDYLAQMLEVGLAKIPEPSFEATIVLLKRLYPGLYREKPFKLVANYQIAETGAQIDELIALAMEKERIQTASDLALAAIKNRGLSTFPEIMDFCKMLYGLTLDLTLPGAFTNIHSLSLDQSKQIIEKSYIPSNDLAEVLFRKVSPKAHKVYMDLSVLFGEPYRDVVILKALPHYDSLSTDQAIEICSIFSKACIPTIKTTQTKWTDPSAIGQISLATLLSGTSRDEWILSTIESISSYKLKELQTLQKMFKRPKAELFQKALPKVKEYTPDWSLLYTKNFSYQERDIFLKISLGYLEELNLEQVLAHIELTYRNKLAIAEQAAELIPVFDLQAAEQIASTLTYHDKNDWLDYAFPKFETLNGLQFKRLLAAGYVDKIKIAERYIAKYQDKKAENAVGIANDLFKYQDKDTWLSLATRQLNNLNASELDMLIGATYVNGLELALELLPKAKNLTINELVSITKSRFKYSEVDQFLSTVIENSSSLTTKEALLIAKTGYTNKVKLAQISISKISDLTCNNAALLASGFKRYEKDEILRASITHLKDLKEETINIIISASYQAHNELKEQMQERLNTES